MKKILMVSVLICTIFFITQNAFGENQTSVEINELGQLGCHYYNKENSMMR